MNKTNKNDIKKFEQNHLYWYNIGRDGFLWKKEETLLIAEELGIKHPTNPATKESITMTSDFCITIKDGNSMRDMIRTTKYKKDLVDRRVMEKFAIENTYWERHGLDWGIVTEEEVDKNRQRSKISVGGVTF